VNAAPITSLRAPDRRAADLDDALLAAVRPAQRHVDPGERRAGDVTARGRADLRHVAEVQRRLREAQDRRRRRVARLDLTRGVDEEETIRQDVNGLRQQRRRRQ
jgi:hypothetical protein